MFVFFNSSGIYLPVPRWSTSLPCLLVSQDSPAQCLISLPWWVRRPLPPTNMRAMKTLLDVKPYVSAGPMTEAAQSRAVLVEAEVGEHRGPAPSPMAEGTSGHFQGERNCKPLHVGLAQDSCSAPLISQPPRASNTPFPIAVMVSFFSLPG